jgi:hypothetical protein
MTLSTIELRSQMHFYIVRKALDHDVGGMYISRKRS